MTPDATNPPDEALELLQAQARKADVERDLRLAHEVMDQFDEALRELAK